MIDLGPFYHGTAAELAAGDLLTAGRQSNYNSKVLMKHIYFTALKDGAGFAAQLAVSRVLHSVPHGVPHVYLVEPTGDWEDDPNVTDKKFPGNPTRSYRSTAPLRVLAEVFDWTGKSEEELAIWREKLLKKDKGEILN